MIDVIIEEKILPGVLGEIQNMRSRDDYLDLCEKYSMEKFKDQLNSLVLDKLTYKQHMKLSETGTWQDYLTEIYKVTKSRKLHYHLGELSRKLEKIITFRENVNPDFMFDSIARFKGEPK